MKYISLFSAILLTALFACNQPAGNTQLLQNRVDSLEKKLAGTYKPGFGEFMSGIQVHHAKLWFAGQYQNWALADFEMTEIKEALEGITTYCTDRPESKFINTLNPALDSVTHAIAIKNPTQFKSSYFFLTSSCNSCHKATSHAFNVIMVPSQPPFSNQDFSTPPVK